MVAQEMVKKNEAIAQNPFIVFKLKQTDFYILWMPLQVHSMMKQLQLDHKNLID